MFHYIFNHFFQSSSQTNCIPPFFIVWLLEIQVYFIHLSHPTDNMTAVRKAVYRWKLPCFQLSFLYSNIRFKRTSCWNHPPKSGEWIQYEKLTDATIKQNHYLYIQFDIMIGTEDINRLKLVFVEEKENRQSSWKTCQLYQNGAPMFHGLIRLLFQGYWILTGRTYR